MDVKQITLTQQERNALIPFVWGYYAFKKKSIDKISNILAPKIERYAHNPDLIQNVRMGREGFSYASFKVARKMNVPFVFVPLHHPRWVGFNYREYINLYREADGVIALTNVEKQTLIHLGVKEEKIFVTGIGPLLAEKADAARFREKYSIGENPVVLFLGQQYQYKGVEYLLKSAETVWQKHADVRFVFIGPRTDFSKKLFAEVKEPRILELGSVSLEDKTDAIAASDILCVPSMQESFGGVYTEGWMMKKPVIGGDIPAVREVINEGSNGFLVTQDAPQIAEKIIELMDNPSRRHEMGEAGYHKVLEKYTWEKLAEKMKFAYHKVLKC
ncbi:glycosyltransferase family 4 protein [Phormidium sp. CCY1219]|uniref:glycosyltransferase family 4 protein n=1 Tax=Phormidium sp. CCY1219 TaxID=2886104 RepID=UPI002D784C0F|nr:glycosyltransferase family 4 protein [Phormidium sp. CCY1219]